MIRNLLIFVLCVIILSGTAFAQKDENPFAVASDSEESTKSGETDLEFKPTTGGKRLIMTDQQGVSWCLVPGDDYQIGSCREKGRCAYAVFVECEP